MFHIRMGMIKDRNSRDLTEAEEFKRWWLTHLEPDTLECEVMWTLGSITANKARGGDGIPAELFQILKNDAFTVLYSIGQQIWKTQQWPQDWKRSVVIPILKKGKAKKCSNYHTIELISHASKMMSKSFELGFNSTWRQRNKRSNCQHSLDHRENKGIP